MTCTDTITREMFRTAVTAAVRAPSVYNVQPWRFTLRDGAIDVRIDPQRRLRVADPHDWAARIACGAALANLRLSLTVGGVATGIGLWPQAGDGEWVATVSPIGDVIATPTERALHAAIEHRHSNRRPFFDAPVPVDVRARLQAAVTNCGAWLTLDSERGSVARIAEIVRGADDLLRRSPAYIAEMNVWLGRNDTDGAGIPAGAAGVAPAGQDLLAMRDYGGTRPPGREFESDPLLAVLGTNSDSRYDDVAAGIALQHLLLTATDERLATSMLSQPIEVPAARDELRATVHERGAAQMVVRIGYGQPVTATGRRPVDAVIDPG